MDNLIKQAMEALKENPLINEIELSDGINKVRVIRNAPYITCWPSWTYPTYQYQETLPNPYTYDPHYYDIPQY